MKTIVRNKLVFILLFLLTNAIAQEQLLPQLIEEHGIVGVAAAYSIDGITTWEQTSGYRNQKEQLPFTTTTRTRIASIAKPMTAIAIMQLVEQGLLELDTPIQAYLPGFPHHITTRQLLAHTAGIGGYQSGKEAQNKIEYATLQEAMQVFQDRDLLFTPGTDFGYSSYGYVVLGAVIEAVSGLSYAAYMQQNIWDKAEMQHTGIEKAGTHTDNQSLLYHAKKGNAKLAKTNNLSNRTPGGGFYSSVADLLKFGQAVVNHTFIKPVTFATMIEVAFPDKEGNPYGLGWFLYGPSPNENAVIGHSGAQTGANTQILIHPTGKIVVVVLANTSGTGNSIILKAVELLQRAMEEVKD